MNTTQEPSPGTYEYESKAAYSVALHCEKRIREAMKALRRERAALFKKKGPYTFVEVQKSFDAIHDALEAWVSH